MREWYKMLTKRDLAARFERRARTWERAYEHSGSEALGKAYLVFLNPRLFSDSEFWKILNVGDFVWEKIWKKAFSLSTLLCFREAGWNTVQLSNVMEIFAGQKHLMVRLDDGEVFPIGSRNVGGAVERIDVTCPVTNLITNLTFDHVTPLEKILREKDRPGLRWLSGIVWDTAVAESNEKDPRRGDWSRGKDGTRYPPKEWLGAKKLKKPVMANLRQYLFTENGPHLQLQSEVVDILACSTELMLRSSNSSRGAKGR
jgi:hypothetical protein